MKMSDKKAFYFRWSFGIVLWEIESRGKFFNHRIFSGHEYAQPSLRDMGNDSSNIVSFRTL